VVTYERKMKASVGSLVISLSATHMQRFKLSERRQDNHGDAQFWSIAQVRFLWRASAEEHASPQVFVGWHNMQVCRGVSIEHLSFHVNLQ
jgi:hypothetical protein